MLRRWLVAGLALVSGVGVTLGLLVSSRPDQGTLPVLVVARDLPAGAPLGAGATRPVRLGPATLLGQAVSAGEETTLAGRRAGHDLRAGQVLQRSDLAGLDSGDRRRVYIPLRDVPPLAAGDRIDLLVVAGPAERLAVVPFAAGLTVRAVQAGGLVLDVSPAAAPALVWAAAATHLVAIVSPAGSGAPGTATVNSLEQARALVQS